MIKHVRKLTASIALLSIELIIVLVLFLLSLFTLAFMINDIFGLKDVGFDNHIFASVLPFVTADNTRIVRYITFFGSGQFLLPANILLAAYFLFVANHRWYSLRVPVVSLGSFIVMSALKLYFSRARPDDPVYKAAMGFSFPSGHAMSSMTFYGLIIFLVWKHVSNVSVRWILTLILVAFICLIGFSRIYLRVHYASDVIAGFSLGVIWLVLSLWVMHKIEMYTKNKIDPEIQAS